MTQTWFAGSLADHWEGIQVSGFTSNYGRQTVLSYIISIILMLLPKNSYKKNDFDLILLFGLSLVLNFYSGYYFEQGYYYLFKKIIGSLYNNGWFNLLIYSVLYLGQRKVAIRNNALLISVFGLLNFSNLVETRSRLLLRISKGDFSGFVFFDGFNNAFIFCISYTILAIISLVLFYTQERIQNDVHKFIPESLKLNHSILRTNSERNYSTKFMIIFIIGSFLIGSSFGYFYNSIITIPEIVYVDHEFSDFEEGIWRVTRATKEIRTQLYRLEDLAGNIQQKDLETLTNEVELQIQSLEIVNNNLTAALEHFYVIPNLSNFNHEVPGEPVSMCLITMDQGTKYIINNPFEIKFEHLSLNNNYTLDFVGTGISDSRLIGFPIAMHIDGYGFIFDPMNQEQISLLFGQIENSEEALELVQLIHYSQTPLSSYADITSDEMFERVVSDMEAYCLSKGKELEVNNVPPVNYTQVSYDNGIYTVKRVIQTLGGRGTISYWNILVSRNGKMTVKERINCIVGQPYYFNP